LYAAYSYWHVLLILLSISLLFASLFYENHSYVKARLFAASTLAVILALCFFGVQTTLGLMGLAQVGVVS
jgi:hypothetical protein